MKISKLLIIVLSIIFLSCDDKTKIKVSVNDSILQAELESQNYQHNGFPDFGFISFPFALAVLFSSAFGALPAKS